MDASCRTFESYHGDQNIRNVAQFGQSTAFGAQKSKVRILVFRPKCIGGYIRERRGGRRYGAHLQVVNAPENNWIRVSLGGSRPPTLDGVSYGTNGIRYQVAV